MADRFYAQNGGTPGITPTAGANWEQSGFLTRFVGTTDGTNTDTNNTTPATVGTGVANDDVAAFQLIIGPCAAQTITGTVKGQMAWREANGSTDARAQVEIRAIAPDGSTVRGTLLAQDTAALSSEFNIDTAIRVNRKFPRGGAAALTSVTLQDGDYVVIAIGYRNHNTNTGVVRGGFGSTTSDLPEDETDSLTGGAANRAWFEFSNGIKLLIKGTAETGAGADASALSSTMPRTDTGSGADASSVQQLKSAFDSGSGAEARTLTATLPRTDTGAGADATGSRTLVLADAATGADSSALRIVVEAVNPFPILPLTLAEALQRLHTPIARLTFIGADLETVLYTVAGDLLDGSVDMDRSRNINRNGSVSLTNETGLFTPDASGLVWPNRLVRLERGAMIGEAPTYAELMTGVLDNWHVAESSGVVTFTVWSRLHIADRYFSNPISYGAGMLVDDVLRDMAEQGGLGSDDTLYSFDSGGVTLAAARTYDAQGNILDSMVKLAFDSGLDLFDDGHGRLVLQPFVDPATASPVWTFAPGALSTLLGATRSGQATSSYNRAVVIGTGPDRYPIRAEARVLNPADPLYNPPDGSGPVGDRPRPAYVSSDINTQDAANAVAQRLLIEGALYEEDVQVTSSPVPILSARDVARVAAAGTDDTYLLDKVTIPLGKGSMTIETRKVRSLLAPS